MNTWILIVAVAAATLLLKVAGPAIAGGRRPPEALTRVIELFAPALIAALIVTSTLTTGHRIVIDARLAGLGAGFIALVFLRVPLLAAALLGAATCAALRLLG
ncbi:AzlD domain-containing protein [Kribbella sp. NPDC026611]|uniref:AzlD domain-containing protein n=1 Tax=Kribbella sp. NPDC026611 TaxID=3154911 RepID=UPI0033DE7BF6